MRPTNLYHRFRLVLAIVLFLLGAVLAQAQTAWNSAGDRFWLGFMQNAYGSQELRLYLNATVATTGTVSIPLAGWSQAFSIPANGSTLVVLPSSAEHQGSEVVRQKGVLITSGSPITVSASNYQSFTHDATLILPERALETSYRVQAYKGLPGFNEFYKSEFLVVATEDDTQIRITPSVNTSGGRPAGVPFLVDLDAGESYQVQSALSSLDLTGTTVEGTDNSGPCRPFAVFSGSMCGNVPVGCPACDHLYEQMIPRTRWGTLFHTIKVAGTTNSTYRILADQAGTNVSIDGGAPIVLGAGAVHEVNGSTTPVCISASAPISVVQVFEGYNCSGGGDPSLIMLLPQSQKSTNIRFSTVNTPQITLHRADLVAPTALIGQLTLDGTPVAAAQFTPYAGCPSVSYASVPITTGNHVLAAPQGFQAYIHGLGTGESYARVLDQNYSPLSAADSTVCVSGQVTLNAPADFINVTWEALSTPGVVIASGSSYTFTPTTNDSYVAISTLPLSGCTRIFTYHVGMNVPSNLMATANGLGTTTVCQFEEVQLGATPVPDPSLYAIQWSPAALVSDPNIVDPIAYPMTNTWFRVTVTSTVGCGVAVDSVLVQVSPNQLLSVRATATDSTICVGETPTLTAKAEQVLAFSTFDTGAGTMWTTISGGAVAQTCGSVTGDALFFNGAGPRMARTLSYNVSTGGRIHFALKIANGVAPCDNADPGEDVRLEYSINGGTLWVAMATYLEHLYPSFTAIAADIPLAAQTNATQFRWRQVTHSGPGQDVWMLENAIISHYVNTGITFQWTPAATLAQPMQSSTVASPNSSTTYGVQATNVNGCVVQSQVHIDVEPAFNLVPLNDTTTCDIAGIQLNATVNSGNGITWSWTPNNGSLSATNIADPVATPQTTTTYTVVATSDIGCQDASSATITVGQLMGLTVSAAQNSLCQGGSTQLNAAIQGNGNTSLVWSPAASLSSATSPNPTAQPTATTTYIATLTDTQSGCFIQDSVQIQVTTGYNISVTPDTTLCNTLGFQLQVVHNVPAPFTIAWSNANLLNSGSIASPTIMADTTMLFTVNVTDANGCGVTASVQITDAFDSLITPVNLSACQGNTVLLDAGFPGNVYAWGHGPSTQQVTVSTTDVYTVEITDSQGCQTIRSFYVDIHPLPTIDLGPDISLCGVPNSTLNANSPGNIVAWSTTASGQSIIVNQSGTYWAVATSPQGCVRSDTVHVQFNPLPTDPLQDITACITSPPTLDAGNPGATYAWSTNAITQSIVATTSGNYSVMVTTPQNCSATFDAQVTLIPEPIVDLGPDTSICTGTAFTLNAGNSGMTYLWNTNATSQSISPTATGIYWVEVSNGFCMLRDSVSLIVNPGPIDQLTDVTDCIGSSATLDAGNAGSTYLWSNGPTSSTLSVSVSGTYTVIVTTPGNCSATFDSEVMFVSPPHVELGQDTVLCQGDVLTLDAFHAGCTYSWSTGAASSSINVLQSGNYSVTVDNGYCTTTDAVHATFNPAPFRLTDRKFFTCLDEEPHYVVISAGNDGSAFDWSTGEHTQIILAGAYGMYFVDITNAYDCAIRDSVTVNEFCPATLYVPNTFTPNSDGINDLWGPVGKNVASLELTVFDRWGGILFESNSLDNQWDGTYAGDLVANDMYVWKMRYRFYEDTNGEIGMEQQQMGHIQVLR